MDLLELLLLLFFPQERSAEQELVLNNKVNLLYGMV